MHDDMYNMKYRQPDTLYDPSLLESLKQITNGHAMFKVTSVAHFGLYLNPVTPWQGK